MINMVKKVIAIILIFSVTFLFGWESASYYILKHSEKEDVHTENVSPMSAFTSLIMSSGNNEKANLETFWAVWDLLGKYYVNDKALNERKMVFGAIKGLVEAIGDPYTVFMDPDETIEFDQSLSGTLEGIGAELTVKDQALVVVTPLKNSPAEAAGLLTGDIVYKIGGELTAEMTLFEAIMNIRGEKGTEVVLTIIREGVEDPFDVSIVRDKVNLDTVELEELDDSIFLLSVYQFNDNTLPELETKINELLLKEPKGLILDLRNNGGGYLEISVDILSEFIEGTMEAVTIKRRNDEQNETLFLNGSPRLSKMNLVVLINNGSASASEIVAGAIQDYKRGVLIGEKSFGKGSVQEVDKLDDGSSLRMTIAKWFTPNGRNIDDTGIDPDIEVLVTDEDYANDRDPQLNAAVDYLKNLGVDKVTEVAEDTEVTE